MTSRAAVAISSILALVVVPACSLPRGTIAPGEPMDAGLGDTGGGRSDVGMPDAVHLDLGPMPDAPPVDGGACTIDGDCPPASMGTFGMCDFGTDVCATTGQQTRTSTTYHCTGGSCVASTTMDSQPCTRPSTDGTMCAAPTYGMWSACNFGSNPCATSGMQTRTITMSTCGSGSCGMVSTMEMQPCTRPNTDGMSCGMNTMTTGTCMTTMCATSGMQTVTTTSPTCGGGACHPNMMSSMQACTIASSDGTACGMQMCSPWGPCTRADPNSCSNSGQQTRTCSTPTCASGTCGSGMTSTQTQACTIDAHNMSCMTCSDCAVLPFYCPAGQMGSRTCTTGTCANAGGSLYCMGSISTPGCTCP